MNMGPLRSRGRLVGGLDLLLTVLMVGALAVVAALRISGAATPSPTGTPSATLAIEAPGSGVASPYSSGSPSFVVRIEPGLQVQWNADAAARSALAKIKLSERLVGGALAEPRILSVTAWVGRDVPSQFGAGQLDAWPVVWVVEAQGTFVTYTCPVTPCPSDSSGWYLFDDTGLLIGSGFPLPEPT